MRVLGVWDGHDAGAALFVDDDVLRLQVAVDHTAGVREARRLQDLQRKVDREYDIECAVFLDDRPSYHLLPQVYYFLGRAQEGMKTGGAAQWYGTFLHIKEKAGKDPLVTDARKRIK